MATNQTVAVDWYGDEVLMRLEKFNKAGCDKLALATEAEAKVNIMTPFLHKSPGRMNKELMRPQVDTGAMVNSTRAVLDVTRLPRGVMAAVQVSAEYGVYQEAIRPFMMPAAETVAQKSGALLKAVARERGVA